MAGLIGFFGSRMMAWVVLGGGGLAVALMVWNGAKARGATLEFAKWQTAIMEQVKGNRAANHNVNMRTVDETGSLADQEAAIRQKWLTMGRAPAPPAKEKQ